MFVLNADAGEHSLQNGLLLRSDLHILFDQVISLENIDWHNEHVYLG